MKNRKILLVGMLAMLVMSCKKEIKEIGEPASKVDGIVSEWAMARVLMTDKVPIVEESMDITEYFASATKQPNIKFYIEGTDTLFSVDTAGLELNFFNAVNGKWRFDNPLYPSQVLLFPSNRTDTVFMKLNGPIRTVDSKLKISKQVYDCTNKLLFRYDLEFIRKAN